MAKTKEATGKGKATTGKGKAATGKAATGKGKAKAKAKEEKTEEKKRGRQAGVSYVVKDVHAENISNLFETIEENLSGAMDNVNIFLEENTKSVIGPARKQLMSVIHQAKELRNALQTGKTDMEKVVAEKK